MTQAPSTSAPILHGRYRIEEQLGAGRLAVVYRAYDERLQRLVLVHMLRKELVDQEALRQRFIQEAHDSARCSHQSLLEVFDSGEVARRPYMITEYVTGRILRELGALSPEEALLYFRQVVGAVAACQAAQVSHPPITSSNIFLVDDGHVELAESWIMPPSDVALDIAHYRAPERFAGGPATPAATVYALGLLLFEMLAGRRAISADTPQALAQAHRTMRIPALSSIRPSLYSTSLERLIQRATAQQPDQRPPNAAALGQELDELRREVVADTQRLSAPPIRPTSLRERINRSTGAFIAPPPRRSLPSPALSHGGVPLDADEQHRTRADENRRRSLFGIAIMLTLLVVVACGTYYGASLAISKLTNITLPRPSLEIPALPDLGIALPDWLTGIVSGGGEVLIVSGVPDEGLNLRNAPGLQTQVIGLLPNGAHLRKVDGPQVVDNVPWVLVRAKLDDREVEGWVSAHFVRSEK